MSTACAREHLVPFEKDGRWGYRDSRGRVVIEPEFAAALAFSSEGLAAVVDKDGWAYMNDAGAIVIRPFVVDNGPEPFREGLARFVAEGRFGYFNKKGDVVIMPRYDFSAPFSEGLAAFCAGCRKEMKGEIAFWVGGKWGYINRNGNVAIPARFDVVNDFEMGKARVKLEGTWIDIDRTGRAAHDMGERDSIGSARMEQDGTIVLQLRAESPGGPVGDVLFRYSPDHGQYQTILKHLGGLEKGQEKPVPPWN